MSRENKTIYALLGILSTGPHSGYDVKQRIEQNLSHFWNESYGQIYPNLKKLVEDGYASVVEDTESGKHPRNVYIITDLGLKKLRDYLMQPVEKLPPEKNEMLLKLNFGEQVPIEVNIGHIRDYQQKMQQIKNVFDQIRQLLAAQNIPESNYKLLTLTFGQTVVEAILKWCHESIEKLEIKKGEQMG